MPAPLPARLRSVPDGADDVRRSVRSAVTGTRQHRRFADSDAGGIVFRAGETAFPHGPRQPVGDREQTPAALTGHV